MKKALKVLVLFITLFTIMIGIDTKAIENTTTIAIPIQKTDKQGNPLEGATFTLKDVNNTKSFDSTDKSNGDYLIQDFNPLTYEDVLAMLPEKYKAVVNDINSSNNYSNYNNYTQDFYAKNNAIDILFPMYIEETVPPTGYKSKKVVIPAIARFNFSPDGNKVALNIVTSNYMYEAGYFEYEENKDYLEIFDKVNYYWSTDNYDEEAYYTYLSNNGLLKDKVVCDTATPEISSGEVMTTFTSENLNRFCVLQIENEKEEGKREPIINPATSSSIIIFVVFILISIGMLAARKTRHN